MIVRILILLEPLPGGDGETSMSIDATVWDVTRDDDGLKLWLADREPDGIAGQSRLIVVGSCQSAERLVGKNIWAAGSGSIMCGDVVVGHRIGYGSCTLLNHGIKEAIRKECKS